MWGWGALAFSQAAVSRKPLQEFYISKNKKQATFLSSAPTAHVVPRRNNITIALSGDLTDVAVEPERDSFGEPIYKHQKLQMKGWSASPLFVFSAKRFGVGLKVETGYRNISYTHSYSNQVSEPDENHDSKTSYTGAGGYVYFIPAMNFLPSYVTTTVIAGLTDLAVATTAAGTDIGAVNSEDDTVTYKYSVVKREIGVNVGIYLAKRLTVFPWAHYSQAFLGHLKDEDGDRVDTSADSNYVWRNADGFSGSSIAMDQELIWKANQLTRYGLDFAMRFGKFNVYFGGALGAIAAYNKGIERIKDNTYTFGVSYDTKSR